VSIMRASCLGLALAGVLWPILAAAQPAGEAPPGDLRAEIEELKRALLLRDQAIRSLARRIEILEAQLDAPEIANGPIPEQETGEGDPPVLAGDLPGTMPEDAVAAEVAEVGAYERREQERLVRAAFEQTLIDRGGLLLPEWTLELEPGFSYVNSSSDNIVIDGFSIFPVLVVGDIVNERIRSDLIQGTGTARIGLPFDSQIEARLPFGYQQRRTVTAENEEEQRDRFGLGDLELALSHQLLRGRGWVPDLLASLRWKAATGKSALGAEPSSDGLFLGSGFDSFTGSLTAVRVSDPVVFFGGLSYTYNDPMSGEIGRFNSGNTFGGQAGLAIALNLDTSVSFAYDQQVTFESRLDGERLPGSSLVTGTFNVGASYTVSPNVTIDFGVGIGVTEESPDVQLSISLPLRFRLN